MAYEDILEALDASETDTTPFPIVTEDELVVAGDANETEVKMYDFEMVFQVPYKEGNEVRYKTTKKEYNDVFITPRRNSEIVKVIVELIPFFLDADKDGTLRHYSPEEAYEIRETMNSSIIDNMYDLVAKVLGIDDALKDFMIEDYVWEATANIIMQYKATVNEAKTFFPKSSDVPLTIVNGKK